MVSACHAHTGNASGEEQPTLYWQWKHRQPYHVDYYFVSESCLPHIRSVEVAGGLSGRVGDDHRPLVVDVDGVRVGR